MKILYVLILLFLTGCGDNYSLDEKRGPNPEGIVTTHPLSLPPDYMLRAPEPIKQTERKKAPDEKTETAGKATETPDDSAPETETAVKQTEE